MILPCKDTLSYIFGSHGTWMDLLRVHTRGDAPAERSPPHEIGTCRWTSRSSIYGGRIPTVEDVGQTAASVEDACPSPPLVGAPHHSPPVCLIRCFATMARRPYSLRSGGRASPPRHGRQREAQMPPSPVWRDPYEAASIALAQALQREANARAMQEYQDHLVALEYGRACHLDQTRSSPIAATAAAPSSPPSQGTLLQELLALQAHHDRRVALELDRQHNGEAELAQPPQPADDGVDDLVDHLHAFRFSDDDFGDDLPFAAERMPLPPADLAVDPDTMTYEELLALGEQVGDVKKERWREISMQVLSRLPTYRWTRNSPDDVSCTVCLSGYVTGDVTRTLPCSHVFHDQCVSPWVRDNNSCPFCMREISKT